MGRLIRHDLKRVLTSPAFWIGVAAFVVLGLLQQGEAIEGKNRMLQSSGTETFGGLNRYLFSSIGAAESRQLAFALPVLAALPAATLFQTEFSSRYMRCVLVRADKGRYALSKLVTAFLSGTLMALCAEVILLAVCLLTDSHPSGALLSMMRLGPEGFAFAMYKNSRVMYALFGSGNLMLYSGVYACLALAFSALWNNKYLTYASGFLLNNIFLDDISRALGLPIATECANPLPVSSFSRILAVDGALLLSAAAVFLIMYRERSRTDA